MDENRKCKVHRLFRLPDVSTNATAHRVANGNSRRRMPANFVCIYSRSLPESQAKSALVRREKQNAAPPAYHNDRAQWDKYWSYSNGLFPIAYQASTNFVAQWRN